MFFETFEDAKVRMAGAGNESKSSDQTMSATGSAIPSRGPSTPGVNRSQFVGNKYAKKRRKPRMTIASQSLARRGITKFSTMTPSPASRRAGLDDHATAGQFLAVTPQPYEINLKDVESDMSFPDTPGFEKSKSYREHKQRIVEEIKKEKQNVCYTWRQFTVSCTVIYGLIAWLQFITGRILLLGEVGINMLVAYTFFQRQQAAYCSMLVITIAAPYVLLWNAILKKIYKDFYADFRPKNFRWWQYILIFMYLFQPIGTFLIFLFDIGYVFYILMEKTKVVFTGLSAIDESSFELESARGITHVLFEGIPKSILFLYVLFIASDRDEAIDEDELYVVYIGLGLAFVNLIRSMYRITVEAEKESIGVIRYIIFRLQLVEITFPAYLPKMAAIYQDKLEVVNYSDVVLSSESSNQLAAAVQSSSVLNTLRFSLKTIRKLTSDGCRVFSKQIENGSNGQKLDVIFTKDTDVDTLWRKIKSHDLNKNQNISHDEWNRFCEYENVTKGKNDVFKEMAKSYPNCIYQRDLYEWVSNNESQKAFALLDQYYPLHDTIEAYQGPNSAWKEEKAFMFCAGRDEFYDNDGKGYNKVLNQQNATVWMVAVSRRLPLKYLEFLKVREDQFTVEDNSGENFILNLISPLDAERDMLYQIDVINHLSSKIPLFELFKHTFTTIIERERLLGDPLYHDFMKYCIGLYFDDTFCEHVDSKAFKYRDLFNHESFESYGYESWIDFLDKTQFLKWEDMDGLRVGQHMSQRVLEWYLRDYSKYDHQKTVDVVQGLTHRANLTEQVLILLESIADPAMIITGIKAMHILVKSTYEKEGVRKEIAPLVQSHLEMQFIEAFKMRVPKNALDLYFNEKFIAQLEKWFAYRNLFSQEKLESYGAKDFEHLISRHNLNDPSLSIHTTLQEDTEDKKAITAPEAQEAMAQYIASRFDADVIRWFLGKYPGQKKHVGKLIWSDRTDGKNLEILLDCMRSRDILHILRHENDLQSNFEELFEYTIPSEILALFFDDKFCEGLRPMQVDFRKLVLPYIHNWPEFLQILNMHSPKLKREIYHEKETQFMTEKYEQARAKKIKKRWFVVNEVCDYTDGLQRHLTMMVEEFYYPIKARKDLLTQKQIQLLFPPALVDIRGFITTLNAHLSIIRRNVKPEVQANSNYWLETTDIADIFEPFVRAYADTFYQYYIDYSERSNLCKALCDPGDKLYKEKARDILCPESIDPGVRATRYNDLIIIPCQIGTRFQSIFERIKKATPEDHFEYHRIHKLFKAMIEQNVLINQRQAAAD